MMGSSKMSENPDRYEHPGSLPGVFVGVNLNPLSRAARTLLVICVGCSASISLCAVEADRSATLEAIHTLENPWNLTRRGPCGELGPYQFREQTWRAYTTEPFSRAIEIPISNLVAQRHYEWLRDRLGQARIPPTTYNIALAWNCGLTTAITGHASRRAHDYAQRAVNLAGYFSRSSRNNMSHQFARGDFPSAP